MRIYNRTIKSQRRPNGVRQIRVEIVVSIAERHETPLSRKTYLRPPNYAARVASAVDAYVKDLERDVQIVDIDYRGMRIRLMDEFDGGGSRASSQSSA